MKIHRGDALAVLTRMPDQSVDCCITSPPYWGLRDYGTAKWKGGDLECDHVKGMARGDTERETPGGKGGSFRGGTVRFSVACRKCGAIRVDKQLGLERTPEEYVAKLVAIFREVRRVLKDDGTLWVNLGDSYAAGTKGSGGPSEKQDSNAGSFHNNRTWQIPAGLKPKDLVGIPWMVAFALRADGWYLRQDIIWHKPAPMPESVKDRCTKSHEYIFMLSKSPRYYYDAAAIAEPTVDQEYRIRGRVRPSPDSLFTSNEMGGDNRSGLHQQAGGCLVRNKRDVWTLGPRPFPEAHFATFPYTLPEICMRAGTRPGGIVLDPFAGAGTTGLACKKNGREFVGIELNGDYISMAKRRLAKAA